MSRVLSVGNRALFVCSLLLAACTGTAGGDPAPDATDDAIAVDTGDDALDDVEDTAPDTQPDTPVVVETCVDRDRDGFGDDCALGPDCNDENPNVNPGADEACGDAFDNDCDGDVDEDCPCIEGTARSCYDGDPALRDVGRCRTGVQTCDGGAWTTCSNGAPRDEICDGDDNDCDGETDEGVTNACGGCGAVPLETCGDFLDNDCNGAIDDAAECTCGGRQRQPCYGGPPATLGFGVCAGGSADCVDDRIVDCIGDVLPDVEICDGLDNDCDGETDENLANACGVCGRETPVEVCNGYDDDCDGETDEGLLNRCGTCGVIDVEEVCGDGEDNNCDGNVDEGCGCFQGTPDCWPGPPETRWVGGCRDGLRECDATGEFWGVCSGMTLPSVEVCDGVDNDCDGEVDNGPNGCSVCGTDVETCDGLDNDCDGQIDENLRNGCGQCIEDVRPEEACGPTCCDGIDNDCDGLIDEGLLNVCGTCGQACFLKTWNADNGGWDEGERQGVTVDLAGQLRLGNDDQGQPYIWVANSGEATVSRVNTATGEEEARFPTGQGPSRTAVDFDGNAYIANRAFYGQGTVTRVDLAECVGADCTRYTAPIGDANAVPRAVAIDEEGFPWVGTYNDQMLRRIDPTTGVVIEAYDTGVPIFGMAIDPDGVAWLTSINIPEYTDGRLAAFDLRRRALIGEWRVPGCSNPYAVTIDADGDVWMSNFVCNNLVRYRRSDDAFDTYALPSFDRMRGVAVDADDKIWVVSYGSDEVARFDPETETFIGSYPVCDAPIGIGVAPDRHVWIVCYASDNAYQLTYDGDVVGEVGLGLNPYSFGDISGFQLRNLMSRRGSWNVRFDCGRSDCGFDTLDVSGAVPAETLVHFRARVSTDGATWSPWAGPFTSTSASLSGLPQARYLDVELELRTSNRDVSPEVSEVQLSWWHP